jgi:hypothetical protein
MTSVPASPFPPSPLESSDHQALSPTEYRWCQFHGSFLLRHLRFGEISGLYYKHVTIVNYTPSGVSKLKASLNDDSRVIINNCHMFKAQAKARVFDLGKLIQASLAVASGQCYQTFIGVINDPSLVASVKTQDTVAKMMLKNVS